MDILNLLAGVSLLLFFPASLAHLIELVWNEHDIDEDTLDTQVFNKTFWNGVEMSFNDIVFVYLNIKEKYIFNI